MVAGVIKDQNGNPIENVSVLAGPEGTTSDKNGNYVLKIPAKKEISIVFSHISFINYSKTLTVPEGRTIRFSPRLKLKTEELTEVDVKNRNKDAQGIISIDAAKVKKIPGANAGVENVLMTLPGVNNNNELSTQYNVRGGNFDENLVYVNGIEVYRPFLVRSGQQEGLSFVNSDMTQNVNFSAGGFQAKYGDRLSSVLDITYRTPSEFGAAVNLSLLGGSATVEGKILNNKLSALVGVRYRDNSLFVNSKDVETNYKPKFADVQTFLSYQINERLKIDFLGNFSKNEYNYTPISRRTKFGTLAEPLELIVYYNGQEQDDYTTAFGALKGTYLVNDKLQLSLTTSTYNTQEAEHYDILASYNLGEVDSNLGSENFGEVSFSKGIGSQLNHARNNLDALISNVQLKGTYISNGNNFQFGAKYQIEDIRDRLIEWEVIDSAGFSIRPPNHTLNNQPYEPYEGKIIPYQNIRAYNDVQIKRISGFAQWSKKEEWGTNEVWYNLGIRAQNWNVSGATISGNSTQSTISPRGQFAIKPDWKNDMLFRFSTGFYHQPPFYKELRDSIGEVQKDVKAQKSIHFVLGNDYSFDLWNRPFKLISEVYYKHLTDVNPYTINNVRIRYEAKNNAVAYATGIDLRLNGEFVPGTESWISMGFMTTKENIDDKGYIPRPTDQRFKFAMLFQDYVPTIPDLKAYLNLVFNTGLPGGSPSYADPYQYQNKLNSYKRADIGISYVFVDQNKQFNSGLLSNFRELTFGVEIFNMFDVQNSITNTWVRDVYSKQSYGIPNYMTGRVFNVKLGMLF
ncbi:TonB-dependent receptor [Urechidicola vernalis]|uniref:Carboxypeptidase-like regulatory domain-containing protein n=1 Tax=Urechidicola vernalis TaxID=3075600 RepID=A0ABU2Y262_9FLAO|nr:carboxypeptidase-like regulatory domain-containing protein [Urechidicola sp. P050]MDT0552293.1 carboxypeptidase-like regulatory domain-containing protein [Urechidicola sp. P050]